MRKRALVALGLIALVLTSGMSGAAIKDAYEKHMGARIVKLHGWLDVMAFAGCDGDEGKMQQAAAVFHQEQKAKTRLARFLDSITAKAYAHPGVGHCHVIKWFGQHNRIVNAGETYMRDDFNNATGSADITNIKYHGVGTSATADAETDTGCTTELTTQYNPDNTRATGSQTTGGANIYQTVGTNTVDASVTLQEFCLFTAASSGTVWSHVAPFSGGSVSLASGDSIQTTYSLTIE